MIKTIEIKKRKHLPQNKYFHVIPVYIRRTNYVMVPICFSYFFCLSLYYK